MNHLHRKILAVWLVVACAFLACRASAPSTVPHKLGTAIPSYETITMTGWPTTPDGGSSTNGTLIGSGFGGFDRYTFITFDCSITTGQADASVALDVYLQKLVQSSPDVWVDFVHFPKQTITLTSATVTYDLATGWSATYPYAVATAADDAAVPVLDAGLMAYGHPGSTLRLVIVTANGIIYTPASVACYFAGR